MNKIFVSNDILKEEADKLRARIMGYGRGAANSSSENSSGGNVVSLGQAFPRLSPAMVGIVNHVAGSLRSYEGFAMTDVMADNLDLLTTLPDDMTAPVIMTENDYRFLKKVCQQDYTHCDVLSPVDELSHRETAKNILKDYVTAFAVFHKAAAAQDGRAVEASEMDGFLRQVDKYIRADESSVSYFTASPAKARISPQ